MPPSCETSFCRLLLSSAIAASAFSMAASALLWKSWTSRSALAVSPAASAALVSRRNACVSAGKRSRSSQVQIRGRDERTIRPWTLSGSSSSTRKGSIGRKKRRSGASKRSCVWPATRCSARNSSRMRSRPGNGAPDRAPRSSSRKRSARASGDMSRRYCRSRSTGEVPPLIPIPYLARSSPAEREDRMGGVKRSFRFARPANPRQLIGFQLPSGLRQATPRAVCGRP